MFAPTFKSQQKRTMGMQPRQVGAAPGPRQPSSSSPRTSRKTQLRESAEMMGLLCRPQAEGLGGRAAETEKGKGDQPSCSLPTCQRQSHRATAPSLWHSLLSLQQVRLVLPFSRISSLPQGHSRKVRLLFPVLRCGAHLQVFKVVLYLEGEKKVNNLHISSYVAEKAGPD